MEKDPHLYSEIVASAKSLLEDAWYLSSSLDVLSEDSALADAMYKNMTYLTGLLLGPEHSELAETLYKQRLCDWKRPVPDDRSEQTADMDPEKIRSRGISAYCDGRVSEAESLLMASITRGNPSFLAYQVLGSISYYRKHDLPSAAKQFALAVANNSGARADDNIYAYLFQAKIQAELGESDVALSLVKDAIASNASTPESQYMYAECLFQKKGNERLAQQALMKAFRGRLFTLLLPGSSEIMKKQSHLVNEAISKFRRELLTEVVSKIRAFISIKDMGANLVKDLDDERLSQILNSGSVNEIYSEAEVGANADVLAIMRTVLEISSLMDKVISSLLESVRSSTSEISQKLENTGEEVAESVLPSRKLAFTGHKRDWGWVGAGAGLIVGLLAITEVNSPILPVITVIGGYFLGYMASEIIPRVREFALSGRGQSMTKEQTLASYEAMRSQTILLRETIILKVPEWTRKT